MLRDSQFAKDVLVADKLLTDGKKSLDNIKNHIEHENKQLAVQEAIKYEIISEKIVNNARIMPITSGIPYIEEDINKNIVDCNNIEIKYLNNNTWFYSKIPSLLPKKEKGNPSYIRATYQIALKKYFLKNPKIRLESNSVIIFKHNYDKKRPEREYRDHDNIELNSIVDLVALYVLIDDTPLRLRHYYCSYISDNDNTEIFIVPNNDFISWLKLTNTATNT